MLDIHKRIFNDDLLLNDGDVEVAKEVYPAVSEALDWPRLRHAFLQHERPANRAKTKSRRRGVCALLVALGGLCLAAAEPASEPITVAVWATVIVAALGVLGVILGSSVLIGGRKERWLHHRAAAERLRQLQFQVLVRRACQLAAADPAVVAHVMQERERVLDVLVHDLHPGVTRPAETILGDLGGAECWLIGDHGPPPPQLRPEVLEELFHAYTKLRFRHQVDYATRKLSPGTGLWPWEPEGQARRIDMASYSLTVIVIVCHLLAVVAVVAADSWLNPKLKIAGMCFAFGGPGLAGAGGRLAAPRGSRPVANLPWRDRRTVPQVRGRD